MIAHLEKAGGTPESSAPLMQGFALGTYPQITPRAAAVRESQDRWPLVADRQFILATRDTGYRSTAAAVSELIDNALQAAADVVHVVVQEERSDAGSPGLPGRRVSIAVLDNGSGMDAATLRTALQFGGSERFNDRTGAGRFGMGLPNSSVSQARRVEVYSWRDGRVPLFSYLDVREIARGTMREVPAPTARELPVWAQAAIGSAEQAVSRSGTLVFWPECDRLPYRKASTVRTKLHESLGQTYRYALRGGVRMFVDGRPVEAVDPLMQWGAFVAEHGAASQYGDELCYEFKVPTSPSRTSEVCVRFSVLPVRRWARLSLDARRELGIIGGAGVSVVRAGREVDYGWHLMGAKRRENYDDWWRCEVRFEPELDEYFGVTHSKQGITPHPTLHDALAADLERIARTLNARVRGEFLGLAASRAAHAGREQDERLPMPGLAPTTEDAVTRVAREREPFLPPTPERIRRFRVAHAPLASPRCFDVAVERGELVVTLNSEHPLYDAVVRADGASRALVDTVIVAAARAEVATRSSSHVAVPTRVALGGVPDDLTHFLEAWSDALAAYLSRRT